MSESGRPRRRAVRGDEVRLEVPRDTFYLASIRGLVSAVARHAGFDERAVRQIVLAVDEACAAAAANRDDHAADPESGEVRRIPRENRLTLKLRTDAKRLEVRVTDPTGARLGGTPLEGWSPGTTADPGGLGYLIISSFMDELELVESEAGNELILTRYRSRPSGRLAERGGSERG
jgi:anti-sigma regulatory factor (Ser/Thr protein kinase)